MRVGDWGLRRVAAWLALGTVGLGAAGCGSSDVSKDASWFSRPMPVFQTPSFMMTPAVKNDVKRAITPEDLVDASGYCAGAASASASPGPDAPAGQESAPGPSVAGGIALGMTECEVVQRAGRPERVEVGADGGNRTAVLTYPQGERAGIYRFSGGRLQIMDRVAEPAKPARPARPARKPPNRPA